MKTIGCLSIALAAICCAQDGKLQFEVASVRVSGPDSTPQAPRGLVTGGPGSNYPERITYQHVPFQRLLMDAYGVQRDQIKGPDWVNSDTPRDVPHFDISAKIPPGATKEQVAAMLQNLLIERFRLAVHRETKEFRGLALAPGKGGAKLKESLEAPKDSERATVGQGGRVLLAADKDGFPQLFPGRNMGGTFQGSDVRMRFREYSMPDLVEQLGFGLGTHVADRSGLSGKYDFTLQIALPQDEFIVGVRLTLPLAPGQVAPLNGNPPTPAEEDAVSVVSSAMEKQLGLKLEAAKITVDTVVVDRVEKTPSEN